MEKSESTPVSYTHLDVYKRQGQFVINPTFEQLGKADMDLMVAATYDNIMMVEGEKMCIRDRRWHYSSTLRDIIKSLWQLEVYN